MSPRTLMLLAVGLTSCAIRSEEGEPVNVPLVLQFPSRTSATVLDDITLSVYDGVDCSTLLEQDRTGGISARPVVEINGDVCQYFRAAVSVEVPLGEHSFLAVGRGPIDGVRGEAIEFYKGCVQQTIGGTPAELPIYMSYATDIQARPNSCVSVQQFCARDCPE